MPSISRSARVKKKSGQYSPSDFMMINKQAPRFGNTNESTRFARNSSPISTLSYKESAKSNSRDNTGYDNKIGTYRAHFDQPQQQQQMQATATTTFNKPSNHLTDDLNSMQTSVKNTIIRDEPRDVYICDCCWISRELAPAYEHLSSLSSLFFLFNFFVFAFGFACFGMGLWLRIDPKIYEIHKFIETQNFTYAGWIILFGGFAACLLSIMGFVATGKKSQCMLILYMLILLSLIIGFIGSLVLLVVHGLGYKLELFLNKEIYEQMRRRAMSNQNDWAAQFLDFIQVKMRCCGAVDFTDYAKLGLVVPTTCYTIEKNYINAPGCGRAIRDLLDIRAGLAVGFLAGSIMSQLLSLILAMIISCSIYQWRTNPLRTVDLSPRTIDSQPKITYTTPNGMSIATISYPTKNHRNFDYVDSNHLRRQQQQNDAIQRPRSRTPIIM